MLSRIVSCHYHYEVPVTILQAYISLPRYIRKGMLIRRIIASDLCTAVNCQQFCKESTNVIGELCLNVIIPFSIIVCCLAFNVMFQKRILSKRN